MRSASNSPRLERRHLLAALLAAGIASPLRAQEPRLFRIATASLIGTYYAIGNLIAGIISSPPGARTCEDREGRNCGVPGLIAVVESSAGSVANVEKIESGEVESGFVQADIAYEAYHGKGVFAGRPARRLRAIAKLYNESLHLLVARKAAVETVGDLRHKRISLGKEGSGTLVDARLVLEAFGLREADLEASHLRSDIALSAMRRGELDGFFLLAGYPAPVIVEATTTLDTRLVPIAGEPADRLIRRYPFFTLDLIPFGVYAHQPSVPTIGVGALWLVSAEIEDRLVYELTRSLWSERARRILDQGHPKGREIRLENALEGVTVPLHPGAERFYREHGLLD